MTIRQLQMDKAHSISIFKELLTTGKRGITFGKSGIYVIGFCKVFKMKET